MPYEFSKSDVQFFRSSLKTRSRCPQEIEDGVPNKQHVSRAPVNGIFVSLVRENKNDFAVPNGILLAFHEVEA